jgi:hypothetical protein
MNRKQKYYPLERIVELRLFSEAASTAEVTVSWTAVRSGMKVTENTEKHRS